MAANVVRVSPHIVSQPTGLFFEVATHHVLGTIRANRELKNNNTTIKMLNDLTLNLRSGFREGEHKKVVFRDVHALLLDPKGTASDETIQNAAQLALEIRKQAKDANFFLIAAKKDAFGAMDIRHIEMTHFLLSVPAEFSSKIIWTLNDDNKGSCFTHPGNKKYESYVKKLQAAMAATPILPANSPALL